jgi:hypothetical protein
MNTENLMKTTSTLGIAAGGIAAGAALAALGYVAFAGSAWNHYGHAARARREDEQDPVLDGFMPLYDVVERHHIHVAAPAAVTFGVARDLDLSDSCLVQAIFRGREVMMHGTPPPNGVAVPPGLVAAALRIGWGVLTDEAGHEIVLGAVTKPWEPNPVFRDLLPRDFIAFVEPGFVKIAFTLRADPLPDGTSIFRTETRALATDVDARAKFRRYWALVSPGVALIRRAMLDPIRREAQRRVASTTIAPELAATV